MIDPRGMDKSDKHFLVASVVAPLIVWWILTGRKKYSAKGMR